jgi:hypothetical protein
LEFTDGSWRLCDKRNRPVAQCLRPTTERSNAVDRATTFRRTHARAVSAHALIGIARDVVGDRPLRR